MAPPWEKGKNWDVDSTIIQDISFVPPPVELFSTLADQPYLVLFGGGLRPSPQRPQQLHEVPRLRGRRAGRPRGAQAGVHAGPVMGVGFDTILCIYTHFVRVTL